MRGCIDGHLKTTPCEAVIQRRGCLDFSFYRGISSKRRSFRQLVIKLGGGQIKLAVGSLQ